MHVHVEVREIVDVCFVMVGIGTPMMVCVFMWMWMSMDSGLGMVMAMEVVLRMVMFKPCAVVDVDRCMCMDRHTRIRLTCEGILVRIDMLMYMRMCVWMCKLFCMKMKNDFIFYAGANVHVAACAVVNTYVHVDVDKDVDSDVLADVDVKLNAMVEKNRGVAWDVDEDVDLWRVDALMCGGEC